MHNISFQRAASHPYNVVVALLPSNQLMGSPSSSAATLVRANLWVPSPSALPFESNLLLSIDCYQQCRFR